MMVPLDLWIRFTKDSPRIHEILHEKERPTAIFKGINNEEIEVIYCLGRVTAARWNDRERADILQALTDHLNEFCKDA